MPEHDILDAQQLMTAIIAKLYSIRGQIVSVQVSRAYARQAPITGVFEQYKKGVFGVHKGVVFRTVLKRTWASFWTSCRVVLRVHKRISFQTSQSAFKIILRVHKRGQFSDIVSRVKIELLDTLERVNGTVRARGQILPMMGSFLTGIVSSIRDFMDRYRKAMRIDASKRMINARLKCHYLSACSQQQFNPMKESSKYKKVFLSIISFCEYLRRQLLKWCQGY